MGSKFGADDAFMRKLHKGLFPPGFHPNPPEFPHAKEEIAADRPLKDRTVAAKKKKSAKKKQGDTYKPKKALMREPELDDDEGADETLERALGHHVKKGFPSQSIKLQGKDELHMVHCPECKGTHYYLALPEPGTGGKKFALHELLLGETLGTVELTPHGDLDTETAMEILEDSVEEHGE
jgi:hypothetical protein